MYGGDDVSAVVFDVGSVSTRAGHAGEDAPKFVLPSLVGQITEEKTEDDMTVESTRNIVGPNIHFRRDNMQLQPLVKQGFIYDINSLESMLSHLCFNSLRIEPKDHPMCFVEPNLNTTENRHRTAQLVFEKYQAPAFYLARSAVLSSFSAGRSTSIVVDCGAVSTQVVPIHDGYALQKSMQAFEVAGNYLSDRLYEHVQTLANVIPRYSIQKHMNVYHENGNLEVGPEFKLSLKNYPNTHESYAQFCRMEIIRDIKETVFRIQDSTDPIEELVYEMPDGNKITLGEERWKIPEVLMFNSGPLETGAMGYNGLPQMVYDAVSRCDIDIRKELYSNVIITGGSSLIPGFTERLQNKLVELTSQNMKIKLIAPPTSLERKHAAWIGGSILASLGSFQQMWMSKQEYEEHGISLLERKCTN